MADNLYDYLNRFNLGQVVNGIPGALQGAADFLNRNQIGTRGIKKQATRPAGYSTYGTYTVGGIEYDIASGRPTYMPPGSAYPSSSVAPLAAPATERAYQKEKARVAQMAAQNPELKRYEDARLKAVAPGATPEQIKAAEDIGMQIWASKHGGLAKQVKPGQAGYDVIQKTLYPGGAPLPELPAESVAMLNAIAPADATGIRPDITPMPGALPVFSDASDAMYQAVMGGPNTLVPPAPQLPSPSAASPQQMGGMSFQDASFETPATKRRSDLFAQLLSGIRQYGNQ
jgi:hypothetical protein